MLEPTQLRFWKVALESGLVTEAQLRACWEQIVPEKRTIDAADRRLARRTIDARLLTVWQAQQLLVGAKASSLRYDRYILLDLLGQGGMGRVYLAKDSRLSRKVALKVLSRERMNNPRALARFRREAKVGAQLQHENLVRIYDEGEVNNSLYLVMEYIEGRNVGQLITQRGPLPFPIATRIAYQVALGLEHAHRKGLVHRDVNPMNIIIDPQGTAKLTDLGLAIDLGEQGDAVTRDGATVGTFDYISPEQARHSRQIDIRADIYSLGCSLYHMLAGRVPFPQPSLPEKLYCHQLVNPDPLDTLVTDLPPGIQAVLNKMLAKKPDDRYESPQLVADALAPFIGPAVSLAHIESTPEQPIWIDPVASETETATPSQAAFPVTPLPVADSEQPLPTQVGSAPSSSSTTPTPERRTQTGHSGIKDKNPLSDSSNRLQPVLDSLKTRKLLLQASYLTAALLVIALLVRTLPTGCSSSGTPSPGTDPLEPSSTIATVPTPENDGPATPLIIPARIRWLDDDTTSEPLELEQAIRQAADKRAEIWIDSASPIAVPDDLSLTISGGRVSIRSATEAPARLQVTRADDRPLFLVQPNSNLTLTGISMIIQDKRPAATDSSTSPLMVSLFTVYGDLALNNCSFYCPPAQATRLATFEGKTGAFTNCAILGFSSPLQLVLFAASEVVLTNCLIHTAPDPSQNEGWALKVVASAIGRARPKGRRLALDHCTIFAKGILAVEDVGPSIPLIVESSSTVLAAPALLGWSSGDQSFPSGLSWTGQNDLFDIHGGPWVLQGPALESGVPSSPRTLTEWSTTKPIQETASTSRSLPLNELKLETPDQISYPAYQLTDPQSRDQGIDPTKLLP